MKLYVEDRYDRMSDDYYARDVEDQFSGIESEERITNAVITVILRDMDGNEYPEEFDYEKEDLQQDDDEFIDYVEDNAEQIILDILEEDTYNDPVELVEVTNIDFEREIFDYTLEYDPYDEDNFGRQVYL